MAVICCTVAEDFIPTMQALIDRDAPPEHILIETSGLALPKPLVEGLRLAVHPLAAHRRRRHRRGRCAGRGRRPLRRRSRSCRPPAREDPSVEHDNPLAEVYEDQLMAADLIVLNKTDLIGAEAGERLKREVLAIVPRAVKVIAAQEGRVDADVLLGLGAAAEDDLAARPSHHDALDGAHGHDDFESFVVTVPEVRDMAELLARLAGRRRDP